jgi:hypothetical protein
MDNVIHCFYWIDSDTHPNLTCRVLYITQHAIRDPAPGNYHEVTSWVLFNVH